MLLNYWKWFRIMKLGQVVWMLCKMNNDGFVTRNKRPFIIVEINCEESYIEFAPLSKIEDKMHKVFYKSNHLVKQDNPTERVISKHSIVQLDNPVQIEYCEEIKRCLSVEDTLTDYKLDSLIAALKSYRNANELEELRCVYLTKDEFCSLNRF